MTLAVNNVREVYKMRRKNTEKQLSTEEKDFEKRLSKVEFTSESDKKEKEIVDLLKQLVNQNEQVIQLLTKLKDRFI